VLEQEKDELLGQSNRTWFITGSLVLLGGILLGLLLPRLRLQKRSRYDSF
jgi:SH3 domain protein